MLRKGLNNCIYAIEGNIASGKSTVLDYLTKTNANKIECLQEQVDDWNNSNLLQLFYEQQERWSYTFESFVQLSRLKNHFSSLKDTSNEIKLIMMERSLWSSYHVFAMNSFEEKRISSVEFDLLSYNFKAFSKLLRINLSCDREIPFNIIYLRTDPMVCYDRLRKRNRNAEITLGIDYLSKIHLKYETWIRQLHDSHANCVHIIDSNKDLGNVVSQLNELGSSILSNNSITSQI